MKEFIELTINGEYRELAVEHQTTLIEVLREHLGLTGAKEACGTGECGSCTVLLNGEPALSCLSLAVDCRKRDIITIEGLSDGDKLTPVQQAFLDCGAIQCGFCTPGMVLSSTALLEENPSPSGDDIEKALEGHLCRCTGYNKIIEAVKMAAGKMASSGK
ncbi:MAG: (2Fe-2S)-binding protein [Thermodesulfobacteriota bacterium]|nr:(2Fe-2S)-binding protein [Thermodesulfobacteriota bacterium]